MSFDQPEPDYTVEEPQTPRPEVDLSFTYIDHLQFDPNAPGLEGFGDADDKLLHLIESWSRADPEAIVESFEEYGEKMIESFLRRHAAALDDGMEQTQRGYLRNLILYVQTYRDTGNATGVAGLLKNMLSNNVVPVVKMVLRASSRQKQARGSRDKVPGRASEVRDQQDLQHKEQAKARIEAEIRRMDEYGRLQMFREMEAAGKLSVEDEMNLNAAYKAILSRKIYLWDKSNQANQGAFSSTVAQLQREMKKTRKAITSSVEAMHGQGVAIAQDQKEQQVMGMRKSYTPERTAPPPVITEAAARRTSKSGSPSAEGTPLPESPRGKKPDLLDQVKDLTGTHKGRSLKDWNEFFRSKAIVVREKGKEGSNFLGYVMQFKADPIYYAFAYGVKARDVVDLFSTYHRRLDYISTVKSILTVMTGDPEIGLAKPLPGKVAIGLWKGRTLRNILQQEQGKD